MALGESKPMTHWPPLYPILLALPQYFGMSGLSAARWLGAVNLGLMVFLLGLSIARLTNSSPWYTGLGTLVLVTSYALWNTSLYAMTEPLYMVLGLLALLFLDNYLIAGKQKWLLSASIVLALGLLTRYSAGALILASVLALFMQRGWPFKKKLRDSIVLGLGGNSAARSMAPEKHARWLGPPQIETFSSHPSLRKNGLISSTWRLAGFLPW